MNKDQKAILKKIGGFLLIVIGLFSNDEFAANMTFSGGVALMVSGRIDLLTQNGESNEVPIYCGN